MYNIFLQEGLYKACGAGNIDLVRYFLKAGADPNETGIEDDDNTPIVQVIRLLCRNKGKKLRKTIKIIELLISYGATLDKDVIIYSFKYGQRALLKYFVEIHNVPIPKLILFYPINFGLPDYGLQVLHYLFTHGVDLNAHKKALLDDAIHRNENVAKFIKYFQRS